MIKQLINDLAYEKISLSQALTRTKIIANRIKNETLKEWITKELNGYDYQDILLPAYRKLRCVPYLVIDLPYGKSHKFPVTFDDNADEELANLVLYHRAIESISIVEENLKILTTPKGQIQLTPEQVEIIGRPFKKQISGYRGVLRSGYLEIGKMQLTNVLEQTKQRLLDTLLELDNQFPNLENDFTMTEENKEKVQNIITNHIYGSNNQTNVATGINVEQTINITSLKSEDETKLKSYGVSQTEIDELKKIVEVKYKDKQSFSAKAMKWLGAVTTSIASKGLYENIPAITEFIHKITS